MELTRKIVLTPGYEHVARGDSTPSIHPMHIAFGLMGRLGACVLDINTGWYPLAAQRRLWINRHSHRAKMRSMGIGEDGELFDELPSYASLEWHTLVPQYEGQESSGCPCDWINGGFCYSSSTTLRPTHEELEEFLLKGEDWLWDWLEAQTEPVLSKLVEPIQYEGA